MITLIDGRQIDEADIGFDPSTYKWWNSAGEDLSNLIFRADKKKIYPQFDDTKENERMYAAKYASQHGGQQPPPPGSTSTWDYFVQYTMDDIPKPTTIMNTAVIWGIAAIAVVYLIKTK